MSSIENLDFSSQSLKIMDEIRSEKEERISSYSNDKQNQDEKNKFWVCFRNTFLALTGKYMQDNDGFRENMKPLFYYFLRYEDFFSCERLRDDISNPSFEKGLLIMGGYGLGKTIFMKVFEKCFTHIPSSRFKVYSANEIVNLYEGCQSPIDRKYFFKRMKSGVICIDDLFTERVANNYGKVDVLKEIIEERYSRGKKTYVTCNYADGYEGDVEGTLKVFAERYGNRIYDRFFEMFNIIEFKGKSLRR